MQSRQMKESVPHILLFDKQKYREYQHHSQQTGWHEKWLCQVMKILKFAGWCGYDLNGNNASWFRLQIALGAAILRAGWNNRRLWIRKLFPDRLYVFGRPS